MKPTARRLIIATAAAAVSLSAGFVANAASSFDGRWAVRVVAESDACDDNYSVSLRIDEGRITYGGLFGAAASGKVKEDGRLAVTVSSRGDRVRAIGALSGSRGSGHWESPNCTGRWTAEKA